MCHTQRAWHIPPMKRSPKSAHGPLYVLGQKANDVIALGSYLGITYQSPQGRNDLIDAGLEISQIGRQGLSMLSHVSNETFSPSPVASCNIVFLLGVCQCSQKFPWSSAGLAPCIVRICRHSQHNFIVHQLWCIRRERLLGNATGWSLVFPCLEIIVGVLGTVVLDP